MPITTSERTFVIGMTLVSCAVFAYSVNTSKEFIKWEIILIYDIHLVSGIIGDMSQRKKMFRVKMMNLNLHI